MEFSNSKGKKNSVEKLFQQSTIFYKQKYLNGKHVSDHHCQKINISTAHVSDHHCQKKISGLLTSYFWSRKVFMSKNYRFYNFTSQLFLCFLHESCKLDKSYDGSQKD